MSKIKLLIRAFLWLITSATCVMQAADGRPYTFKRIGAMQCDKDIQFVMHPHRNLFAYASDVQQQIGICNNLFNCVDKKILPAKIFDFKELESRKLLFHPSQNRSELAFLGLLIKFAKDKDQQRFEGLSILDVETGAIKAHHNIEKVSDLLNMTFNNAGTRLAVTVYDGEAKGLYIFDPENNYTLCHKQPVEQRMLQGTELAYLDDGRLVLASVLEGPSYLHELICYQECDGRLLKTTSQIIDEPFVYPCVKGDGTILCHMKDSSDSSFVLGRVNSDEFKSIILHAFEYGSHIWAYDNRRALVYKMSGADNMTIWRINKVHGSAKQIMDFPFHNMHMREDGAYILGLVYKTLEIYAVVRK